MTVALSRLERLERAWLMVRIGRDPDDVAFSADVLPELFAALPDTNMEEIAAMFDWLECKYRRELEELRRKLHAN